MAERRTISESFYLDAFEESPDLHLWVEVESGEVKACNRTCACKLGREKSTIVGGDISEQFEADSRPVVRRALQSVAEKGQVDSIEASMRVSQGGSLPVSMSATAVDEEGAMMARFALRDISEFKAVERRLREKTERLQRSNQELEQFAYLASHDLQEPLRMVASYTQLLERRYRDELDERARKYIDYAVEGAGRMKDLINDLLQYSRLGGPDGEFEDVDVAEILDSVVANLKVRIRETDAEIRWGEMPTLRADATQLRQIFQNLVENALKFRSEESPRVEIEAERLDEGYRFAVADNGIGFEEKNADRIFNIFQRLHERGEHAGTGTGLAIVKKLVENHGGEVSVVSSPGEGTTFYFTISE